MAAQNPLTKPADGATRENRVAQLAAKVVEQRRELRGLSEILAVLVMRSHGEIVMMDSEVALTVGHSLHIEGVEGGLKIMVGKSDAKEN